MLKRYRPLQPPDLQHDKHHSGFRYREYAPSEKLAAYIACYWTIDSHASAMNRVIPDGCVDIILDRYSPFSRKAAFIEGLMTRYEVMSFSEPQSLFGIRFYPEMAQLLLKCPVTAFIGHRVFLEEVWGPQSLEMVEEILSASTDREMIDTAERAFLRILSNNDDPTDRLLHAGMQYMYASNGTISVSALADKLSFSERHIRRTFDRELGLSPKEIAGIVKFQSMLQELHSSPTSRLTEIAMKFGYYDQSHFIKSFKRFYGLLPTQLSKTD
jgi:AraC-like DNA-binding protein